MRRGVSRGIDSAMPYAAGPCTKCRHQLSGVPTDEQGVCTCPECGAVQRNPSLSATAYLGLEVGFYIARCGTSRRGPCCWRRREWLRAVRGHDSGIPVLSHRRWNPWNRAWFDRLSETPCRGASGASLAAVAVLGSRAPLSGWLDDRRCDCAQPASWSWEQLELEFAAVVGSAGPFHFESAVSPRLTGAVVLTEPR